MQKKIFLLLVALLVIGSGCATQHFAQDLFNQSRAECGAVDCSQKFLLETREASDVDSNMLQLNGAVRLTGGAMVWWFEYGPAKDQLRYSTEPKILTGSGLKPVKVSLKKLRPNTLYFYRVVGFSERQQKVVGAIYYEGTIDPSCLGAGTFAAFAGPAMLAGGFITANPFLISGGVMVSSSAIFDEETFGNESDARCKAVAGLLGGVSGYTAGKAYENAHKPKQLSPSQKNDGGGGNGNPPPTVSGVGTGTGPVTPPPVQ